MNSKLFFGIGFSLLLHILLIYTLGTIAVSQYEKLKANSFNAVPISTSTEPFKKEYQIALENHRKSKTSIRPQPMIFKNPANIEVPYVIEPSSLGSEKSTFTYETKKDLSAEIQNFSELTGSNKKFANLTLFGIHTAGQKFYNF